MAATKIRCERCLTECGNTADDGHVIEFYTESDGRIHCEACVDGEVNTLPPIPGEQVRYDALMKADHLIEKAEIDDDAVRRMLDATIDRYYFSEEFEVKPKLALTGMALRREAALHIAQMFIPEVNSARGRE